LKNLKKIKLGTTLIPKPKIIKNHASVKRRGHCYEINSGGVLLSHAVTHVVSSALQGLTSEFVMGSGVDL
jgi:hypothetical protein